MNHISPRAMGSTFGRTFCRAICRAICRPIGREFGHTFAAAVALSLAACGGDGGSSSGSTPPVEPTLTVSGTAATGAVISGGAVEAVCAAGTGTATTSATGTYSIVITNGSLPCALRVTTSDGSLLHSAAAGDAGATSATANLSPLTELVIAQAIGVSPATFFDEFAARQASLTPASLADAVAAVEATLATVGIDLASANPLSGALAAGNTQDQLIDALQVKLADTGTSLAALVDTVAITSTSAPATALSGTPSLPPALLLQPAAANCAALRSGTYRLVLFEAAAAGSVSSETVELDATALTVTNFDGSTESLMPIGTCRFTTPAGAEIVVSQAGVISVRGDPSSGIFHQGIAFPEQSINLALLAGAWNALGFERDASSSSPAYTANAGSITFGVDGKVVALTICADVKTCVPATGADLPVIALAANPAGGFDFVNTTDAYTDRLFAYRTGGGELLTVLIAEDGSFSVLTRQRSNAAPTVGANNRSWNQELSPQLLSNGLTSESSNTIASVDATGAGYTRTVTTSTGATYAENFLLNQPRDGYNTRSAATATASDGSTVNVREFITLSLRGTGMSVLSVPSRGVYTFSVGEPGGVSLPAVQLYKPFAANCTALRSGTLRFVEAVTSVSGEFPTGILTFDPGSLQLKRADGSVERQFTANGLCRYASADGSEMVVSQAGIAVFHVREQDGTQRVGVAFAEQAHTVDELAGNWTKIGFSRNGSGVYTVDAAAATYDAAGASTSVSYCADVITCVPVTDRNFSFSASPDGGFLRTNSLDGATDRTFAYRSGTGDLMLVQIDLDGSLAFWTPQGPLGLPNAGARTRSFDALIGSNLQANGGVSDTGAITVLSVDAAAKTWLRSRRTASGALYTETLAASTPREGYTFRAASTPSASDGATVNVREFTAMGLKGMGISPLSLPEIASFDLSVQQP